MANSANPCGEQEAENNLVFKAARALQAKGKITEGAQLHLTKNIPVGAGLGGGSADAAAALRGLSRLWNIKLNQRELKALALTLGADVAMCLDSAANGRPRHRRRTGRRC